MPFALDQRGRIIGEFLDVAHAVVSPTQGGHQRMLVGRRGAQLRRDRLRGQVGPLGQLQRRAIGGFLGVGRGRGAARRLGEDDSGQQGTDRQSGQSPATNPTQAKHEKPSLYGIVASCVLRTERQSAE